MTMVTDQQISDLVQLFYGRAREHAELGPVFNGVVDDWDHHLQIVQNFWSHVLLGTDTYKGHPYPVHTSMPIPIQRQHFDAWLELFREAAHQTLPTEAAEKAIARAEHMATSFKAGLFPFDR
ncbi:group III truncated hemoglobin [Azomonas macrocytogenes]|uniref:Hemoglobin n=1 Tax=Azomonas macrocytogenes TaxID=69962 RepID=A0A839T598_AZOMA|nr:group III truncated hemoglobin [Azomonas macrocytogenes]MBB3103095.1 hemoglobin [Azomonas macrocytogenes]